jgi:hypothetical protein
MVIDHEIEEIIGVGRQGLVHFFGVGDFLIGRAQEEAGCRS